MDNEKPLDIDMRAMSFVLAALCGMLAVYRLYLIARSLGDGSDETTEYAIRQLVYTYTWVMMGNFFYNQYKEQQELDVKNERTMKKTMEYISLAALVGSIANTVVLIMYYYQNLNDFSGLIVAHNIAESIVWIFISLFLATFYFWHREVRRELQRQKAEKFREESEF